MFNWLWSLLLNIFVFGFMSAVVAAILSPLQFMKIRRQQTGQRYSKIYNEQKMAKGWRGFFISIKPYSILNFYSSAAFGIAEFISQIILGPLGNFNMLSGIFIRAIAGGGVETLVTVKWELKEIERNKGELMEAKPRVGSIILSLFVRNILSWFSPLLSYYILIQGELESNYLIGVAIALVLGVVFGTLSLPLDVISTQNCGAEEELGIIGRFRKITSKGVSNAYAGSLMRILQMAIFNADTSMTEILIKHINKFFGL